MTETTQIKTNFDKTKAIIKCLVKQKLAAPEHAFCLYLLDQQYAYGEEKSERGENSGYGRISKLLGYSRRHLVKSVTSLENRKIIIKENSVSKYGNRYRFNENTDQWLTGDVHITNVASNTNKGKGRKVSNATPYDENNSDACDTSGSVAHNTGISEVCDTRVVLPTSPVVMTPISPNNKLSPLNNPTTNYLTIDDNTVNEEDAFRKREKKNDDVVVLSHEKLSEFFDLLRKEPKYAHLNIDAEYHVFKSTFPEISNNKSIMDRFGVWMWERAEKIAEVTK